MRFLILSVCALLLAACATSATQTVAPEPTRSVDADRFYSGVWREIGRRPMSITDGCVAGATRYWRDRDRVQVRDTCQQGSPTGRERAIGGPAIILDPGRNAKLRVHYRLFGLIPITRDYWVLDHDDAYTWFISCDPTFRDLWIYTRDPHPSAALVEELKSRAQQLGYDVSHLEFPAQP